MFWSGVTLDWIGQFVFLCTWKCKKIVFIYFVYYLDKTTTYVAPPITQCFATVLKNDAIHRNFISVFFKFPDNLLFFYLDCITMQLTFFGRILLSFEILQTILEIKYQASCVHASLYYVLRIHSNCITFCLL